MPTLADLYLSTFEQIKAQVNLNIQALKLPGIASDNIVVGKIARDRADLLPALPGIFIANYGNKAPVGGTNARDDIPYQILVACLQASNNDQKLYADRITYWIERIGSRFRQQALPGPGPAGTSVYTCQIMQDVSFDPAMFGKNVDASVLIFKFLSREGRG
jgi:hypothetical protein